MTQPDVRSMFDCGRGRSRRLAAQRALGPVPSLAMRERVDGAVVALMLRDNCARRVRAGRASRPVVEHHLSPFFRMRCVFA